MIVLFSVFGSIHVVVALCTLFFGLASAKMYSIEDEPAYSDYTKERANARAQIRLWWVWEIIVFYAIQDALWVAKNDGARDAKKLRDKEMKQARKQLNAMKAEDQQAWLEDFQQTVNNSKRR